MGPETHPRETAAMSSNLPVTIQEKRVSAAKANRKWRQHISVICREYTKDAVLTLVEIMTDPNAHTPSRIRAASEILDRGWGKSPVNLRVSADGQVDLSAASDAALQEIIRENTASLMQIESEDEDEDEDDGEYVTIEGRRFN